MANVRPTVRCEKLKISKAENQKEKHDTVLLTLFDCQEIFALLRSSIWTLSPSWRQLAILSLRIMLGDRTRPWWTSAPTANKPDLLQRMWTHKNTQMCTTLDGFLVFFFKNLIQDMSLLSCVHEI